MISTLSVKNFTVFSSVDLNFSTKLNVVVGENGAGKTHLIKLLYSVVAASADEGRKRISSSPTKSGFQGKLAEKILNVFRPESLGRLARRRQGRERCDVVVKFDDADLNCAFSFATNSKNEVSISDLPRKWEEASASYIPTRELMSIFPNFTSIYDGHYLEFEESWRDTCILLGAPLQKGPKENHINELLSPLEDAMGGSIELDRNGRFYLRTRAGRMEMPLVAEGLRKLGMIARLIATGALLGNGYLFWDEPEANLNPKIIRKVAQVILDLSKSGIQVFIATHSLFLLREIDILTGKSEYSNLSPRYFGLHREDEGVCVCQGGSLDDIGDITSLEEDLKQSDRFLGFDK